MCYQLVKHAKSMSKYVMSGGGGGFQEDPYEGQEKLKPRQIIPTSIPIWASIRKNWQVASLR